MRAAPRAGPALRGWQVERDPRRPRAAGPARTEEQHCDPGRHGVPDRDRRKDLSTRWGLPADAQGQPSPAHAAVVEHFDQHCFHVGAPSRADCDAFDDTHGRLVRRRVFASTEAATLGALSGWPGLRTVLAVESIRSVNSAPTKVESEIRYFLSSCPDSPPSWARPSARIG